MTPLRRRMIEDMRIRNLAPHTQRAYLEQVSRWHRQLVQLWSRRYAQPGLGALTVMPKRPRR